MADTKISGLTAATTPLDGTEILPIVQSSTTKKVANNDLRPKQIQSNATSGVMQVAGPAAGTTRVMTIPNANFTAARTDAAQTFTGDQTFNNNLALTTLSGWGSPFTIVAQIGNNSITSSGVSDARLFANIYYDGSGYKYVATGYGSSYQQTSGGHNWYTYGTGSANAAVSSNTTLMTLSATGDLTNSTGNYIQGTAAKGINFTANTAAAGMTSQLLNWYEEGTWTPVVSGTGTAGTYQLAAGTVATYTRIGRQVTINASIILAAAITGGGTGSLKITGLPFAKASGQQAPGVFGGYSVDFDASVLYASTFFSTTASSSTLLVTQYKDNTAYALLPITAIAANSEMYISVTYFA